GLTHWKFHAVDLGPVCADMFTYDIDGDGKADIISSSAHNYGMWWHQQKAGQDGPTFVRRDLFLPPPEVAKLPKDHKLSSEEVSVYNAVNKMRNIQGKASWKMNADLSAFARATAEAMRTKKDVSGKGSYKGVIEFV